MTELPRAPGDLVATLDADVESLGRELAEIELLVGQARTEAARHEQKRAVVAEKSASLTTSARADPNELADLNDQVVRLTRRAAVMEAQADVLEGKQKTLVRYRDGLLRIREQVAGFAGLPALSADSPAALAGAAGSSKGEGGDSATWTPSAIKRLLQAAQEDLRRDISRAMHDGPAQGLTNVVLQAQILDRLLERDPAAARSELRELVAMVQRTLEATKSFIFDVRPMVLDDLGIVPTLRRVARDRSRRAHVPVEFDSAGSDRRLSMELETAVFRIVDEALAAYAELHPGRLAVALDWGERELEVTVDATSAERPAPAPASSPSADLPPALAAFLEERRTRPPEEPRIGLPTDIRREIIDRAAGVGGRVSASGEGPRVRFSVPLPPLPGDAEASGATG
jgi:two-component system, NarL family, sensor histidine kinase DegS